MRSSVPSFTSPPADRHTASAGLYDPANEHDACGVAFVVDVAGHRAHRIVEAGLSSLCRMSHRGAAGADPDSGDGAGIMLQVPDEYYRAVTDFALPEPGGYATGLVFCGPDTAERVRGVLAKYAVTEGMTVLGWRDVPVDPSCLGPASLAAAPEVVQVFMAADDGSRGIELDRRAFAVRKQAERELRERSCDAAVISLSSRTIVYKGMLTPAQLGTFYPELHDERLDSALALVHSRFSTNTFPSWPLAHPYRMVAHNGEINTIRGNRNWMTARQAQLATSALPGRLKRLYPICTPGSSDSANFDEVVELLHLGGRSLPHAMLMMIPEAWESHATMDPKRREFYRFHASMMEPWDGPACVAFTDGTQIGAVLDRNGLRPARWCRTTDGLVVLASESGVVDLPPESIAEKGRLTPGRMFLVDTAEKRIIADDEIKDALASEHPYADWTHAGLNHLDSLPEREHIVHTHDSVRRRQRVFGYTEEELRMLLAPMAATAAEPVVSMGTDTPVASLSKRPRLLYDYFTQLFAQVTNPPLDAIREELVTSLGVTIGPEHNLLEPSAASCRQIELSYPVIDNDELAKILSIDADGDMPGFKAVRVSGLYKARLGAAGMKARLVEICRHVSEAIEDGVRILVLSDRDSTRDLAPIPSLLLTAAVHQHLVREQTRTQIALVVETGDCRTVHHAAVLLGYGAAAINPYLAFESIEDMIATGALEADPAVAIRNYVTGLCKGVLKIMSKMGISTVSSYCGAQVFEAVGLDANFTHRYFTGTDSRIGGAGLADIAADVAERHAHAYTDGAELDVGGEYQWRRDGEVHLFNPETVFLLQHSTRSGQYDVFKKYTSKVDALTADSGSLRGLLDFAEGRTPIPIDEVEDVDTIVRRFSTGAMSYGALSAEAHETLAIAMNRLGGKSNSGEGGEDVDRLYDPLRRSAVKQVASGRFGVTSEYLVNADDIQIKMAQGAKPGEGGQLPGNKVYPWIASTRHATPGVGLISPPPHHDIYSIEDLAQLIHDLKHANRDARIHVKLVSEVGVGTVAAGVAKAHADVVLISGHDGGTGAAPANSVKHAGAPWEIGLAETQQTLLRNGLRDRVSLQVDGAMKTGRDVVVAALLGAEEYGFATAPLIVSGCVMMRVCHLDTCPVGVATQNPKLRENFTGKAEFVENFFRYIAEEVRELLASLGMHSLDEAIGHTELLRRRESINDPKAAALDLSNLLWRPELPEGASLRRSRDQEHELDDTLGQRLVELAAPALTSGDPIEIDVDVANTDRSVGTLLGSQVTRRFRDGLAADTITVRLRGTAGQSFAAFLPAGVTLRLSGDANDYVGKGLSGGRVVVRPDEAAEFAAEDNIIAGNTLLYGATSGELYCRGRAGERFAVRNSGAVAVVEGVGDHGCEYMTGGTVVVLGPTGRNFGAGMSGGQAYVHRLDPARVNQTLVDLDDLGASDIAELHKLLRQHRDETGSAVAARLLSDWPRAAGGFTKVIPVEYKRALAAAERAEAEAMEARHG
ncbi:glutamate synthase large subunit [Stackebrandtia nassauensis]|uniref:Glutamate synthase (Ferredoxin) n=1 Tax=Stackebrandtia nassauensis (strain DSM 44728 / CIP 108903 / NRRL B-16338 / NBRC 102104 / LLR-40K-21) TaxID=446470 RepID=D3PYN0_STANL|nr:glutamate synthase large subunit [Stackebrandtia nassauensis]ADD43463.1 Glutamate synthase (ferredoxin) [Stackebrandtia nassauensis DSM 44728]